MNDYIEFINSKLKIHEGAGIDPRHVDTSMLFDHQRALVQWACRKGRSAVFADTGLGKTRIQLKWGSAIHAATDLDIIILAPLAVAEQTVREGLEIGVSVGHARSSDDVRPGITITNYDRLHRFDTSRFGAVVRTWPARSGTPRRCSTL